MLGVLQDIFFKWHKFLKIRKKSQQFKYIRSEADIAKECIVYQHFQVFCFSWWCSFQVLGSRYKPSFINISYRISFSFHCFWRYGITNLEAWTTLHWFIKISFDWRDPSFLLHSFLKYQFRPSIKMVWFHEVIPVPFVR